MEFISIGESDHNLYPPLVTCVTVVLRRIMVKGGPHISLCPASPPPPKVNLALHWGVLNWELCTSVNQHVFTSAVVWLNPALGTRVLLWILKISPNWARLAI